MKTKFCTCAHTLKDHTHYKKVAGKFRGQSTGRCKRCRCFKFIEPPKISLDNPAR